MHPAVTAVQATDNFELILEFDGAEFRVFDVNPLLNFGRFSELKDLEVFKSVRVVFDTIEWSNELDLDPEYLYKKSRSLQDN